MKRNRHGAAFVAAGVAAALTLAGAAVAAMHGHSAPAGTTVKVTEREYRIEVSKTTLDAGTVTFSIHNAGKLAHALAVGGSGMRTVRTPQIKPGATRTITVKLAGGTARLWCPVAGHAALGMKASLTVKGAGSSAGTTTGSSSGSAWG